MMRMGRILLTGLLALFFAPALSAQVKMSVSGSPVLNTGDADAMTYYRQTDENDEVCAILKVHPTNPLGATLVLNTGGGLAPVPPPSGVSARQEDGSWWFWVSPRVKNISFSAQGYTLTNTIGVSLSPGKVYEIKLVVDALVRQVQEFSLDKLVMKLSIEPMECIVSYGTDESCNLGRQVVKDGYFEEILKKGLYHFRVEQSYYEPYVGVYRVDEQSSEQKIVLQPSFGYLKINTNPEGAEVYVDGFTRSLGQTPLVSRKISKGTHTLHIWKENYYSEDVTVEVNPDGQEQELALVRLRPQFVNVTCLCEDKDADLVVLDANGKETARGKSGMQVRLNSHVLYKLEASRPHYLSQSTGITLRVEDEGGRTNVSVGAPLPIYGGLQISSTPTQADVYLDGKKVGKTTYIGKVLSGTHTLELRKEGYWMDPVVVEVKDNQTLQRNITLKKGSPDGTLNIDSKGSWKVRVMSRDGSFNGTYWTPVSRITLPPGQYTATIEGSSSNRELVKTFTVTSNKEVNLTMNPAKRYVQSNFVGASIGFAFPPKTDSDNSYSGSSSSSSEKTKSNFMFGLTYTYLPKWVGPSFSLYFLTKPSFDMQFLGGIAVGLDLLFVYLRGGYSTYNKWGFEVGGTFAKYCTGSIGYYPNTKQLYMTVGLTLPLPFK